MTIDDFYNDFLVSYDNRDLKGATQGLMKVTANIMTNNRQDFIDLLTESGVEGDFDSMSDSKLIDTYVNSLPTNKVLRIGTSFLAGYHNQTSGFDGPEVSNSAVKAGYHTLCVFFRSPSENYSQASGIGAAVTEGAKLGQAILAGQQKKKYGVQDTVAAKQAAKAAMAQQVLANRQQQMELAKKKAEAGQKTTRTVLIVAGSLAALGLLTFAAIKLIKKK